MTGGGFGGSCIALVDRDKISGFVKQTEAAYFSATARNPLFHSVSAADGAYAAAL
jgi:galactokinase